jgi:hypothetical protein
MVGLPVLVYAPEDVDVCSHTVLAVSRLIQPVEYLGDIRPFLSIFDEDYPSFRSPNAGACVVGITSPMALSQLIGSFSEFPSLIEILLDRVVIFFGSSISRF